MEIFKYIPGIKFREVTASASIYVALGELFALGEFSRWLINLFRPLTRKFWEVLVSHLPLDIVLTLKEKDALTALLLFLPLGFVGINRLVNATKRNKRGYFIDEKLTVLATFFAWLIFIILLFNVIILEEYNQHDGFKRLFGVEVLKYISPIVFSFHAIFGLIFFLPAIKLEGVPDFISRTVSYIFVGISCFFVVTFPLRFPGLVGVILFLVLILIIISVRYSPRSYVTITLITALITISSVIVDFIKGVLSQV